MLENLRQTLMALMVQSISENVIGPVNIRVSAPGNQEPREDDFKQIAIECCDEMDFIFDSIFVIHDDDGNAKGFTKIRITCYNRKTVTNYIDQLHKKIKVRSNPKQMMAAFNKAITIADDFNNRFGEGKYNKTEELNKINEVFDLMKDITGKSIG